MKLAKSVAVHGSSSNYNFHGAAEASAPTGRGQTFDAARDRVRRQLLSPAAGYRPLARLIGLALLEHLNREPGRVSTSRDVVCPPSSGAGTARWSCWPSIATLAAATGIDERSVQRHLQALIAGPSQLFVRHRPPKPGAPLFVHRSGKVHTTNGCVYELVTAPRALRAVREASTAASAPQGATKAPPTYAEAAQSLWTAYAAAWAARYGKRPKGRDDPKLRRIAASVTKAWRAAEPATVAVPWDRLVEGFLASDHWRAVSGRHEIETLAGLVPVLAEDIDAKPTVRDGSDLSPEVRARCDALFAQFEHGSEAPARLRDVDAVVEATRAQLVDVPACEGLPPAPIIAAVKEIAALGWRPKAVHGPKCAPAVAARKGQARWLDVPPQLWSYAATVASSAGV